MTTARDRILSGLHGNQSHDVESSPATSTLPWTDDIRGDDKTRIWRYLLNLPAGSPIPKIVQDLFGVDPDEDEREYQRHRKFVTRFVENAPIFKIDRQQQYTRVEPRPAAFHLRCHKQQSNTDAVGRSEDSAQPDSPTIVEQSPEERSLNQYPKDFAQNFLATRGCHEITPNRARVIEQQFAAYREQIAERWNILRNIYDEHPEYLLVPYRTLYNDETRVSDNWRRYHGAWQKATEEYSKAVCVTLTTTPWRFSSLDDMATETSENFNGFMSWVAQRLADRCDDLGTPGHNLRECPDCETNGTRPDYIKVLEWTDKGRPHLHVIIFGVNWLAPQQKISEQWQKSQARVVDVREVRREPVRNGTDGIEVDGHELAWFSQGDDDSSKTHEKAHMGKYLTEQMPANESVAETRERVGDDDDLWKTALFWATGKRFWSCSEDLSVTDDEDDEDALEDLAQYVFVGAAKSGDIPKHVWQSSVKMMTGTPTTRGKDPPD
jgi:hypothetical protein